MSLADGLERQAAALRASAAEHQRQAGQLIEKAEALEEAAAKIRSAEAGLSGGTDSGTLDGDMLTPGQIGAAKQFASRKGKLHPLQRWIYQKPRDGEGAKPRTLADVAAALDLKEEQVRSWCRVTDARRIPEATAKDIEKRWGFPATTANWPNGIKVEKNR